MTHTEIGRASGESPAEALRKAYGRAAVSCNTKMEVDLEKEVADLMFATNVCYSENIYPKVCKIEHETLDSFMEVQHLSEDNCRRVGARFSCFVEVRCRAADSTSYTCSGGLVEEELQLEEPAELDGLVN